MTTTTAETSPSPPFFVFSSRRRHTRCGRGWSSDVCSSDLRVFDLISPGKPKLPEVIYIDEFKGNAETGKYQCIITDPKNRKVLDILPGREAHHLSAYFSSFPREERQKVKVVVIDMWKPYARSEER